MYWEIGGKKHPRKSQTASILLLGNCMDFKGASLPKLRSSSNYRICLVICFLLLTSVSFCSESVDQAVEVYNLQKITLLREISLKTGIQVGSAYISHCSVLHTSLLQHNSEGPSKALMFHAQACLFSLHHLLSVQFSTQHSYCCRVWKSTG